MMGGFSNSFLIFFHQVALGGLLALAATPFQELNRAFYKSTGGMLFLIALLSFWGRTRLYYQSAFDGVHWPTVAEILFGTLFVVFFGCYVVSLWGERQAFRARSFAVSILTGTTGLILSAHTFYDAAFFSVETLFYPVSFLLSSLLLGSVTVGMLIGHWYLIDTGQTLEPFIRIYKFFVISLLIQTVFLAICMIGLHWLGDTQATAGLNRAWQDHSTLLIARFIVGHGAPLVLAWMIWRTLLIPHTMAATGLFYIALLSVFVGEILGKQLLVLTSLPL